MPEIHASKCCNPAQPVPITLPVFSTPFDESLLLRLKLNHCSWPFGTKGVIRPNRFRENLHFQQTGHQTWERGGRPKGAARTTQEGLMHAGQNRTKVLAALASTCFAFTACSAHVQVGQPQTSSPTSTSSTTSTNAAQAQDNQLALQMLDAIVRGDYDAATTHFNSGMKQKLSPQSLGAAWTSYQKTYGTYQSHGDPEQVRQGDSTVVTVPLQMQNQPGLFRVYFQNNDGTVSGLWFLKAGTPVPAS